MWNWTCGDTRSPLLRRPAFQPSTPIAIRLHISHHPLSLSFSLCVWLFLSFIFYFDFVFVETLWYQNSNGVGFLSMKVLIYGRERSVILEAVAHDNQCVLANILAAHFLHSSDSSRALTCLHAAESRLVPSHLLLLLFGLFDSFHKKENSFDALL